MADPTDTLPDAAPAGSRRATCSCGQLVAIARGEPVRVSMCHCLACQRRTGSTFGAQARFPSDRVTISGQATEWTRTGDSGNFATFRFCPTCGATVCWELGGAPGFTAIPIGAFADPAFPAPRVSVYEEFRHAWTGMPADVEHMD
jgi:hypothetical protein